MNKFTFALSIACALSVAACSGGGGKCEKALDKTAEIAMNVAVQLGGMTGGDAAKMEEAKKMMKADMDKKRPEAIKKCEEAVKANPEVGKALDCVISAADMEAMQKCDMSALEVLK